MERLVARGIAIAMIALLAFLTFSVVLRHGLDPLVIVSLVVLAVIAVGVLGALGTSDE